MSNWREKLAVLLGARPDNRKALGEFLNRLAKDGVVDKRETSMIEGVLRMRNSKIKDVMLRRADIVGMQIGDNFETAVARVREYQHSRYPVFDKNGETVVGILLAKDLLAFADRPAEFSMEQAKRKPIFEPTSKPLNVMLDDFRLQRSHMVIAIDEHAQTAGIVTIEDLLERIVGEIQDESDDEEDAQILPLADNQYRVRGGISVEEFNAYFKSSLPAGASDSIAGWLAAEVGQTPKQNEKITANGFTFTIEKADERRIYTLLAQPAKK